MQTDSTYTQKELALLLKDRNNSAFAWLYDHYSGALYGFIVEIVSNTEMATDVLQKVFVSAWKNIQHYDADKGSLFTWLLRMAHQASTDLVRSSRNSNDGNQNHQSALKPTGDGNELNATYLGNILEKLETGDRVIFDMIYFKGYRPEEIARMQSISAGAVQSSIRNVLIRLREILK